VDVPVDRRDAMVLPFPCGETFPSREMMVAAGSSGQDPSVERLLSCCRSILNGAADRLERNLITLGDMLRQLPDGEPKASMEQQRRQIAVQLFMLRRMLAGL
jgi:hypothetical protein